MLAARIRFRLVVLYFSSINSGHGDFEHETKQQHSTRCPARAPPVLLLCDVKYKRPFIYGYSLCTILRSRCTRLSTVRCPPWPTTPARLYCFFTLVGRGVMA